MRSSRTISKNSNRATVEEEDKEEEEEEEEETIEQIDGYVENEKHLLNKRIAKLNLTIIPKCKQIHRNYISQENCPTFAILIFTRASSPSELLLLWLWLDFDSSAKEFINFRLDFEFEFEFVTPSDFVGFF
jgi:type I site-specific restriction-modification system R (restriction) subunit